MTSGVTMTRSTGDYQTNDMSVERVGAMGQVGTWYPNYSRGGSHIGRYKKGPSLLRQSPAMCHASLEPVPSLPNKDDTIYVWAHSHYIDCIKNPMLK